MALALFTFTQKNYPIPYEYKKIALMTLVCAITASVVYALRMQPVAVILGAKIALLTLYPVLLFFILRARATRSN